MNTTEGPGSGVLTRSNQEHHGCGREECTPGQGVLHRDGDKGSDGEQIPWRVRGGEGGGGELDQGESGRVG